MKHLFHILLLALSGVLRAQSISPEVLNSAGDHRLLNGSNASVTYNVGEPFTETLGPANLVMLTQGFIQPAAVGINGFSVTPFKSDVTCSDKSDGLISTTITALMPYEIVAYVWTPSVVCPGGNCSSVDSLPAGHYSLQVIYSYTLATVPVTATLTVPPNLLFISDANGPCKVKIFNGVNIGGGQNAHLYIENITEFPNNRLTIYNRWGAQLYDQKGYDNTSNAWPASDELGKLLPSTYFYVLDLGDGSKPIKGWLELVKN